MAIPLDGTGGLFTRLGRLGRILLAVNAHQSDLITAFETEFVEYDSITPPGLRDVVSDTIRFQSSFIANQGNWLPQVVQTVGVQTLLRMVALDKPSEASSVAKAVAEVIRQMKAASEDVKTSTVSVTAAADSNNLGDGTIAVSSVRTADGLPNEMLIPEAARFTVTSSTAAQFAGAVGNLDDVNAPDWPAGSNANTSLPIRTMAEDGILTNGGFETFTIANTPDDWTIEAGVAGTQVLSDAAVFYEGLKSVKFVGNATGARISQAIDDEIEPLTSYAMAVWLRTSGVPAAGVLTLDFTDSSGTVLNDMAGTANTKAVSLPGLTGATWTPVTFVFRTSRIVPAGAKIRIRLSTALSVGTNLNIDRAMIYQMNAPFNGGPLVALFQGATEFPAGDFFTITSANNRGGATENATFQALFDRMFNMRSLGLQLPSDAAPTLPDTLITS